jgi:enoyl-CoA hydratase
MVHAAPVHAAQHGAVLTITLHRPHCRNAVDGPTASALRAAFEAFEADDSARVAVLTGGGGHF